MPQDFLNNTDYLALHAKELDVLSLSAKSHKLLIDVGVETIGDCADYFLTTRIIRTSNERFDVIQVMETEVMDKLKEQGYWATVSNWLP